MFSDLGDMFIKDEKISFGQLFLNAGISGALGAALSGVFFVLSKGFTALKLKFSGNANRGPAEFAPPKNNSAPENIAQTKPYVEGCNDDLKDGALSDTVRVSTKGQLGKDASEAAATERAAAVGNPYQGHVCATVATLDSQPKE